MGINPGPQRQSPVINLNAMDDETRLRYDTWTDEEKNAYLGFGDRPRPNFDVPAPNLMSYEHDIAAHHEGNCTIICGLDRPNFEGSGFGGKNATHCATIDICAGRKAWFAHAKEKMDGETVPVKVDNDFVIDAARIYVSQKTDVDGNFRLKPGSVGNTSMEAPRSTIALKADTLRFIARENIKIVTRTDKLNAQGGKLGDALKNAYGIDIVAMNDTATLQPMVRGENLKNFLVILTQCLSSVVSTFDTYVSNTRDLHNAILLHTHLSPFYGSQTSPDFTDILPDGINTLINNVTDIDVGNMTTQMKFNQLIMEWLDPTGIEVLGPQRQDPGPKNILSPYNSNN